MGKAIDTGLSTTSLDWSDVKQREQLNKTWGNFGIKTGVSLLASGVSVGASAAGGAVTGALGGATNSLASFTGSFVNSAINTVGNYGLNIAGSALSTGLQNIGLGGEEAQANWNSFGRNAMTSGISSSFNLLGGLATSGISAYASNPYGAAAANYFVNAGTNEAGYWLGNLAGAAYDGKSGADLGNYMSSLAGARYGNADYWANMTTSFASTMVSTAATEGLKKSWKGVDTNSYSYLMANGLLSQGINRSFSALGGLVSSSVSGNWSMFGGSMTSVFDLGSAYNQVNIDAMNSMIKNISITSGMKAAEEWKKKLDAYNKMKEAEYLANNPLALSERLVELSAAGLSENEIKDYLKENYGIYKSESSILKDIEDNTRGGGEGKNLGNGKFILERNGKVVVKSGAALKDLAAEFNIPIQQEDGKFTKEFVEFAKKLGLIKKESLGKAFTEMKSEDILLSSGAVLDLNKVKSLIKSVNKNDYWTLKAIEDKINVSITNPVSDVLHRLFDSKAKEYYSKIEGLKEKLNKATDKKSQDQLAIDIKKMEEEAAKFAEIQQEREAYKQEVLISNGEIYTQINDMQNEIEGLKSRGINHPLTVAEKTQIKEQIKVLEGKITESWKQVRDPEGLFAKNYGFEENGQTYVMYNGVKTKVDYAGVTYRLPDEGKGYEPWWGDGKLWGKKEVVETILNVAYKWNQLHPDNPIMVGHLSAIGGNGAHYFGGSLAHIGGMQLDLKFITTDKGNKDYVDYDASGSNYSEAMTQELIQLIVDNSSANISQIYFNDTDVISAINLSSFTSYNGHKNHIHITFYE